jgi:Lipocalin-like domain
MQRISIFGLSTMMAFGLALLPGSTVAQQKTLKEQLVGTWMLVSAEVTPLTGAKRQDFGANAKGILILDAGGRYAAMIGDSDRPKFKTTTDIRLNTPSPMAMSWSPTDIFCSTMVRA